MEDCIFCKIVKGKILCNKIYEDKEFMVFLDTFPAVKGQTLVIPKEHYDYIIDSSEENYTKLMLLSKKIAQAIDKSLKPLRTGIMVEGLQVAHAHVKIYPLTRAGFKDYMKQLEPRPSEQEMAEIANKIRSQL
ncbi:MAG: HIT domain-containing protein [Candidatus Pacearchaeota archaeon]|nr:HIT domain-containing protein [Candidatus Pacearchaeota archaeon]